MAQSRVQPLNIADLIAAYKNTGAADAVNAASKGLEGGVSLANSLAMKRLEQQKLQSDMDTKKQNLIDKAKELALNQQKVDQNSVSVQNPVTLGQVQPKGTDLPANAPVASYDPNSNTVTPDTTTTKMSPEAFKVQNPDVEDSYKRALALQAKTGQPIDPKLQAAAEQYQKTKTPESFTIAGVGTTPETKGHIKVLGSKDSSVKDVNLGNGFVPPTAISGEAREKANDIRQQQYDENKLQHFAIAAGGLSAGGKSAVGIAAKGNLNADRALDTLASPNLDPQALGGAVSDLASLYSGGAATLEGLKSQEYNTLQQKIANLKTYAMSRPEALNTPEVKNEIINRLHEIKDINNQLLERNMGIEAAGIGGVLERNPKAYDRIIKAVTNAPTPTPVQVHSQALDWANANPNDPRAAAIKAKATQALTGQHP